MGNTPPCGAQALDIPSSEFAQNPSQYPSLRQWHREVLPFLASVVKGLKPDNPIHAPLIPAPLGPTLSRLGARATRPQIFVPALMAGAKMEKCKHMKSAGHRWILSA
jgi:hypothetical protein